MKKALTLFFSLFAFLAFGQLTSSVHYSLGLPKGKMANNLNAIHQGGLSVGYRLPKALRKVQIGADLSYGGYGRMSMPVELQFDNSKPTKTNINYSSNVFAANGFLQMDVFTKGVVTPYLMVKGGVQDFHSSIYVEDPTDTDGCQPLENENILSDETMTFGYGGGLRFQLPAPNYDRRVRQHFIDVQFLATRGGSLDYINAKKLTDHSQHTAQATTANEDAKSIEMRFINVTSKVVHAHKVAEVYNSPLRLLEVKVAYYVAF